MSDEQVKGPIEDEVLDAMRGLSEATQKALCVTRWKDGIDLEYPNHDAMKFAAKIAARSEQALAALEARNKELESAARGLVDAMETCHICKGTLLVSEEPAHCEDCSWDCECHEEPECLPIYEFHRRLRAALKGAS